MLRSLTLLALVFAQAAACAGGPMFLCVDRAGAVCLDGGPKFCGCCETSDEKATSACASTPSGCHDHDHEAQIAPATLAWQSGDCDCSHQLVSNERVATVSRASGCVVEQQLIVSTWMNAASHEVIVADFVSRFIAAPPLGDSLPLNLLSSVAMRC